MEVEDEEIDQMKEEEDLDEEIIESNDHRTNHRNSEEKQVNLKSKLELLLSLFSTPRNYPARL